MRKVNLFNAKYIIRLDDACHQMPLEKWTIFENYFNKIGIKPIIGVIPMNKDPKMGSSFNKNFWSYIKKLENNGWSIAMHGLNHLFQKTNPKDSFFNFGDKSEFVGKSLKDQQKILTKSLKIFEENKISPSLFMAPSHTFDSSTLKALELTTKINVITDGFSFRPFKINDFYFLPQQLWSVKKIPYGFFTICIHPTSMTEIEIHKMIGEIDLISESIISFEEIDFNKVKSFSLLDFIFSKFYLVLLKIKLTFK